jgi:ADP-ribose pyrophosphatase YjhB (NUDIX family)
MESSWLTLAKRLQGIASTGLHYSNEDFDKERYADVAAIANEMLSSLGNIPLDRIENLVSDFAKGYATPKVDIRGAVVERNKVLLVRERSDGLWSLPGGFAEVGLSPADNIVKEMWEEATIKVRVTAMYNVRHKAKHAYDPDARDFYKIFFICDNAEDRQPMPGAEISEVGFFESSALPPLSTGRVLEEDIAAAFVFKRDARSAVVFD